MKITYSLFSFLKKIFPAFCENKYFDEETSEKNKQNLLLKPNCTGMADCYSTLFKFDGKIFFISF